MPGGARIDQAAVGRLLDRVRRDVDDGLLPSAQVALAVHGELVAFEAFGAATTDDRYVVFSATKPIVAGAVWALIGDGALDVSRRVVEHIPEFGSNGKDVVTVEQVMLHTAGFPTAPLRPTVGATTEGRLAAFAKWRLNWEPGTAYEYHSSSAHWVLAELLERIGGQHHHDLIRERVTTPAGLPPVLGVTGAVPLVLVGDPASAEELEAALGIREYDQGEVTDAALLAFNEPEVQAVGMPAGGGVMRAADLALFYQAVLHNPGTMWRPDILDDVRRVVRTRLADPLTGVPANRTLGLVQAGDDGLSDRRGMGRTVSRWAVGHNGAKGQIAWGDPETGLSLGYCTNGLDRNLARESRRTSEIATLAGRCVVR